MAFFLFVFLHFARLFGYLGIMLIFIRRFGRILRVAGISLSKVLGLLRGGHRINLRRLNHLKRYARAHLFHARNILIFHLRLVLYINLTFCVRLCELVLQE